MPKNDYDVVIGLEIHFESKTKSKMFCSCLNDPNEKEPNTNICPVCMAHPGTLPVINKEAIDNIIKTGIALNCEIANISKFDRKNYFYPDLPKGYQISQFDLPICSNGYLCIHTSNGKKKIRINRIHQEEDTGKLSHSHGKSFVDFNRAGVPLMELVTEADISSAEEAVNFAKELQLILKYLGVSDANMEKGEMRVEVNISLKPCGQKEFGTKTEIKNLNSFKTVERAIEFEIERQSELLDNGGKVVQETRGWHDQRQESISQRAKEDSHEYRYFPEPDLPQLEISLKRIEELRCEIPELPEQKRIRFKEEYGIEDEKILEIFIENRDLGSYLENIATELKNWMHEEKIDLDNYPSALKLAINYLTSELLGYGEFSSDKITPENFAEFILLIYKKVISSKIAKVVLKEMYDSSKDPSNIIEEKGLKQIDNDEELENIINQAIENNPKAVEEYKEGKEASFQFLIGQIMALSKGKANPQKAQQLLRDILNK
jgi:aspartyl-tRNA(Asn)/glutamyl-tRNA(Gln) amidotransferase subunit B